MDLEEGSVLDGRYELVKKIGAGGFGTVYKATQISTGQTVAIKVLNGNKLVADSSANLEIARFEREMKLIAQLKHPNIVRLIDTGQVTETDLYTVLEYVEGQELAQLIKEEGALKPREAKDLMFQVLDALAAAHQQGIVHRDMKPQNIMVTTQGFRRNAMVLDFGIAGIAEEARQDDYQTLTMAGRIQGTPAYMAPEQLRGERTTPSIDIYAWGLVFVETVTGRQAIVGNSMVDLLAKQVAPEPVPIPEELLATEIGQIIAKATAKDQSERYTSADEALRDLDACNVPTDLSFSWTGTSATDEQMNSGSLRQFTPSAGIATQATATLHASTVSGPMATMEQKKSNSLVIVLIVLVLVLGGVAAAIFFVIGTDSGDEDASAAQKGEKENTTAAATDNPDAAVASNTGATMEADTAEPEPALPTFEAGQRYTPKGTQAAEMVFTQGGELTMGSSAEQLKRQVEICKEAAGSFAKYCPGPEAFADQSPPHAAEVEDFFIDLVEVSNADYQACVQADSCTSPNIGICHVLTSKGPFGNHDLTDDQFTSLTETISKPELPVTCVSRPEAENFCRWAGKTLPTEPQWEYAATAGGTRLYPWGDDSEAGGRRANGADLMLSNNMGWKESPRIMVRMGMSNVDHNAFVAKTGAYPDGANPLGVLDLSGNVKEWVDGSYDIYGPEGKLPDPKKKGQAVARGGGWADLGPWLSGRIRAPLASDTRRTDLGFRCAVSLETILSREGTP